MSARITPALADDLACAINAHNAALSKRAERITHALLAVLFAVMLACFGAWAVLVYLTPCEAGTLCMAAAGIPTRTSVLQRLRLTLRAWRLRWLLADVEATLAYVEDELQTLPAIRKDLRRQRSVLRFSLAACELGLSTEAV